MRFDYALARLRMGCKLARAGWNGKGMWVKLHTPAPDSDHLPHIYMKTADAKFVPWLASQTDLLAEDWHRVD